MQRFSIILNAVLLMALIWVVTAYAGTPAGPGTVPSLTNWYSLETIYNRLNAGTDGSQSAFTEPSVAPGTGTMYTLNEVMGKAPAKDNTNGATTTDVAKGKTFWGLNVTSGQWGLQTGTASSSSASVPKTGQTICYDASGNTVACSGTGQDGDKLTGVALPSPRFTDNTDGTITDNLTGLIWLKNANCANAQRNWATALSDVTQLNTDGRMNSNNCGDTSNGGSHQTDWRLPNVRELQSLIHYGYASPALSNTVGSAKWTEGNPFTGVQTTNYWSSSTYSGGTTGGWYVYLIDGHVFASNKTSSYYVWPVRGGG